MAKKASMRREWTKDEIRDLKAMAKSKTHAKEKSKYRSKQRTPSPPKPERKVVGSSSTWTKEELDRFNVIVTHDIDPKQMIPHKFFKFDELKEYKICIHCPILGTHEA